MTDQDLQHWLALCEKATPGPWEWDDDDDRICKVGVERLAGRVVSGGSVGHANARLNIEQEDADFIVAARTAVPALIAEVQRLRKLYEPSHYPYRAIGGVDGHAMYDATGTEAFPSFTCSCGSVFNSRAGIADHHDAMRAMLADARDVQPAERDEREMFNLLNVTTVNSVKGPMLAEAGEGTIWMCGACGKTNKDRMKVGDESCYMKASLVDESSIVRDETGRAISAKAVNDPAASRGSHEG